MTVSIFPQDVRRRAIERVLLEQKNYPSRRAAIRVIAPEFGCTEALLWEWIKTWLRQFRPRKEDSLCEGNRGLMAAHPSDPPARAPASEKKSETRRVWREHRTEEMLDGLHELQHKSQVELLRRLNDEEYRESMSDNLLNALHGTIVDKIAMKERWQAPNNDAGGEFIGNLAAGLLKVLESGASVKLEIGTNRSATVDVTPRSKRELEKGAQTWSKHPEELKVETADGGGWE